MFPRILPLNQRTPSILHARIALRPPIRIRRLSPCARSPSPSSVASARHDSPNRSASPPPSPSSTNSLPLLSSSPPPSPSFPTSFDAIDPPHRPHCPPPPAPSPTVAAIALTAPPPPPSIFAAILAAAIAILPHRAAIDSPNHPASPPPSILSDALAVLLAAAIAVLPHQLQRRRSSPPPSLSSSANTILPHRTAIDQRTNKIGIQACSQTSIISKGAIAR